MWKLLLVVAAVGGAASESFLSDISRNLRSEMADVIEMANVTYSEPVINVTYTDTVEFDMRAMGFLYNATHLIIDFIANKQAYPEGESSPRLLFTVRNGRHNGSHYNLSNYKSKQALSNCINT
jgi:hypothetical protein